MLGRSETFIAVAMVLLCLAPGASGASGRAWPTLLGSREAFSPEVSAAIERIWFEPTLRRTIHGPSARAPIDVYAAFVDAPDLTAAAARFRRIRSYEIHVLGGDRYWGDDGEGARGVTQVLRREPQRRVILSQGEQTSPLLGTISGSALTVLELESMDGTVRPKLTAYVYIDNRSAAALTRLLAPTFGFIADRKLGEGLRVTSAVTEWAVDPSGDFCSWLAHESLSPAHRDRMLAALPSCAVSTPPKGSRPGQSP
jgi:hypothetical protein